MENDRSVNLMIEVPASLRRRLKIIAAMQETSVRKLVMDAMSVVVGDFELDRSDPFYGL